MFQIKINDTVQAVSPSLESALKALPSVIRRYTGRNYSNQIEFGDKGQGINYLPWCHSVKGTAKVSDEVLTIFITKIPVV